MPSSEPTSESQRLALLNRLCEVLGDEEAKTLMESLPAVHWHNLATKDDIFLLKDDLKATNKAIEASEQRLRVEMHAEFKTLRAENKENRAEMTLQFAKQTRMMVFTMLGLTVPILGAILGVGLT